MNDAKVTSLSTADEFRELTLQLALQAQRQITILTSNMEPELYNTTAFIDATLALIKRSRYTRIRILAAETKHITESGHKVLRLFRYADEQFQLKKYNIDPASIQPTYFICDDHSIIRRQNASIYKGLCYTDDRTRVKSQLEDFDEQWRLALPDPNLRQLVL